MSQFLHNLRARQT